MRKGLVTSRFERPDSGFTLTEMLVALVVISLSMAGLLQAVKMVSRTEHRLVVARQQARQIRDFSHIMATQLLARQPIIGDIVDADATSIYYACDAKVRIGGRDCHLSVPEGKLSYVSSGHAYDAWPLQTTTQDYVPHLEAVIWQASSGKTLAVIKLSVEQASDCQFDMITRVCRTEVADQASSAGG